ncbi:MAG: cytidylate kinase-like family protein [Clostridia bacterium]|nr:cytidylate kinase-like family protein [Clostridia bacterium]
MNKVVITIARQYGSGGREIGERVAELLSIPNYDKELIRLAVNEDETLNEQDAHRVDERATNSLLYTLAMGSNMFSVAYNIPQLLPANDKLFIKQSEVIRRVADEGSCVVVGRCGDYVLRDDPARLSVFIYADLEDRKSRVATRHDMTPSEALEVINKTDRRRSSYYNFYTGGKWGKYDNYHLALNSSLLGIEGTARVIAQMAQLKMERENGK